MIVEQFRTGGDRNFGYLVADQASGEAMVIDASFNPGVIVRFAADHGFFIRLIMMLLLRLGLSSEAPRHTLMLLQPRQPRVLPRLLSIQ